MTDAELAFRKARQRRDVVLYIAGAIASIAVGIAIVVFLSDQNLLDSDAIIEDSHRGRRGGSGAVMFVVVGIGFVAGGIMLGWMAVKRARGRSVD